MCLLKSCICIDSVIKLNCCLVATLRIFCLTTVIICCNSGCQSSNNLHLNQMHCNWYAYINICCPKMNMTHRHYLMENWNTDMRPGVIKLKNKYQTLHSAAFFCAPSSCFCKIVSFAFILCCLLSLNVFSLTADCKKNTDSLLWNCFEAVLQKVVPLCQLCLSALTWSSFRAGRYDSVKQWYKWTSRFRFGYIYSQSWEYQNTKYM